MCPGRIHRLHCSASVGDVGRSRPARLPGDSRPAGRQSRVVSQSDRHQSVRRQRPVFRRFVGTRQRRRVEAGAGRGDGDRDGGPRAVEDRRRRGRRQRVGGRDATAPGHEPVGVEEHLRERDSYRVDADADDLVRDLGGRRRQRNKPSARPRVRPSVDRRLLATGRVFRAPVGRRRRRRSEDDRRLTRLVTSVVNLTTSSTMTNGLNRPEHSLGIQLTDNDRRLTSVTSFTG